MTTKQTIIVLMLTFFTTLTYAQRNVIKVNPLGFFYGYTQAAYERGLNNEETSIELMAEYTNDDVNFNKFSGVLVEFKYKFFFPTSRRSSPFGWYSAPLINYKTLSKSDAATQKILALSGGVVTGVQWNLGDDETGLTIDLNLGSQYSFFFKSEDIKDTDVKGFQPRAALALGFCF